MPNELRMKTGVADVITVAKATAQLRAAVFCAGVVIGTLHHIHTPDAVTGLQFFWGKARRRAENAPGGFDENAGNKAIKPRYVQQGGKLFVARSRQALHIAVNGLQCLLFRHDPLQGLVGRNARQYLPLEVILLFLASAFSVSSALRRISKAVFSSFARAGKRSATVSRKSRER